MVDWLDDTIEYGDFRCFRRTWVLSYHELFVFIIDCNVDYLSTVHTLTYIDHIYIDNGTVVTQGTVRFPETLPSVGTDKPYNKREQGRTMGSPVL